MSNKIDLYPALNFSFPRAGNEEKLINLCSRIDMSENGNAEALSLVKAEKLDWDHFLGLATTCRVVPFAYRHLQPFDEYVPAHVKQVLREEAGAEFARNISALEDIRSITELFREEGIEVLFIKGVPFMLDVYVDMGLRGFGDIDVLVKDFRKAEKVLKRKGFKPYENRGVFNSYRSQRLYTLDGKVYLDVHVDFMGRRLHNRILNIDKKRIWEGKREVNSEGVSVYTLDVPHTLLYGCMHLSIQHGFLGLIWYVDIHEFINKYGDMIDWDDIRELARSYRILRPVYYCLLFTKRMLGTPVPDNVLESMEGIERKIDHKIFDKIKANNAETDYLAELTLFDSVWDTVKFVLLSLVVYPYLIVHFLKIFGKILGSLSPRRSRGQSKMKSEK